MSIAFRKNDLILYQGASVTASGRTFPYIPDIGIGYTVFAAQWLWAGYPELQLRFLNRAIPGDDTAALLARWQTDCIDLQPNWVSIMNGGNDAIEQWKAGKSDPARFEVEYRELLDWTLRDTDAKLIIWEPWLFEINEEKESMRPYFDPIINAVRRVARDYPCLFIPLDGMFHEAWTLAPYTYYTEDGIHLLEPGYALVAQQLLRKVGAGNPSFVGSNVV